MKHLIINADDYGMDDETSRGIRYVWEKNRISATSIMPTEEGFYNSVEIFKSSNLNIPIGVHLSISGGTPISNLNNSSITSNNKFSIDEFDLKKISQIDPDEIELEFDSQIKKVIDSKISISHIDNHMFYIYLNPKAFERVVKLSNKYNIPLRWPFGKNKNDIINSFTKNMDIKEEIISELSKYYDYLKSTLTNKTTDFYFQIPYNSSFESKNITLMNIINHLPDGVSELCLHPGYGSENRENDLKILCSDEFQSLILKNNVIITNHSILR